MPVCLYQVEIDATLALSVTYCTDGGGLTITSGTVNGVALPPAALRAILQGCANDSQQGPDAELQQELAGQHDDDGF